MAKPNIQLVSLDIDGCIFRSYDFSENLEELFNFNYYGIEKFNKYGDKIVLNTGRNWKTIEGLVEKMGNVWAIYEHGMGYYIEGKHMGIHEMYPEYKDRRNLLRGAKKQIFDNPRFKEKEIEKDHFIAIKIPDGVDDRVFLNEILEYVDKTYSSFINGDGILIKPSHGAIDIRLNAVTKASGIEIVSRKMNIPLSDILSIDDADIEPMTVCGYAACPNDASQLVIGYVNSKGNRGYIATLENGEGTIEILNRFLG